jgi:hypothetical protein
MRTLLVLTEVLLQGMRDMLHDRGGKRKAETGVGIEATAHPKTGLFGCRPLAAYRRIP